MENAKTISVLNDLLIVTNDRLEGYEKVEGKVWEMNHSLQNDYEHMTSRTKMMKNQIINLITDRGGKVNDSTSISGSIHKTWIDIKNSFLINNLQESTLESVLFGEDAAIKAYQEALDSGDMDTESTEIISEQLKDIKDYSQQFKGILENKKEN